MTQAMNQAMGQRFADKVAVVTGSAQGIGRRVVERLLAVGKGVGQGGTGGQVTPRVIAALGQRPQQPLLRLDGIDERAMTRGQRGLQRCVAGLARLKEVRLDALHHGRQTTRHGQQVHLPRRTRRPGRQGLRLVHALRVVGLHHRTLLNQRRQNGERRRVPHVVGFHSAAAD